MFDSNSKVLSDLANDKKWENMFLDLVYIEEALNKRFAGLQKPIRALTLAAVSGQPLLLIGPPGTAKSRLIRAFCVLIGLLNPEDLLLNQHSNQTELNKDNVIRDHRHYFEYLLTPFTEPGELFGYYDINKAVSGGKLERIEEGMMQNARVVYLDEVFNGSSAILNSILAFLNERIFHDRGIRRRVAMQCLFAATNRTPETPELRAIFDRFVLRCMVDNVEAKSESINGLLKKGWFETYAPHNSDRNLSSLLDDLEDFRRKIMDLTAANELTAQATPKFYNNLTQRVQFVRQYDLSEMSNRRLVQMIHVMLIYHVYKKIGQKATLEEKKDVVIFPWVDELDLLSLFFLDRFDEEVVLKIEGRSNR